MAICRKICCCDFSEDKNLQNNNNSVEMKNQQYSPSSNYGRDQRTSSLISNTPNQSPSQLGNNNNSSNNGLHDPLMSPQLNNSSNDPLAGTLSGTDGLPMSPLMLNHNASFASRPSAGSNGPISPGGGGGRKRAVSFAPKGFEQPKSTTTSVQPNGAVKGIYRHRSSYGPGGPLNSNNVMEGAQQQQVKFAESLSLSSPQTQQALGSPYAGTDATGGREPPDLSLL